MEGLISVIIPVYNVKKLLHYCVISVLQQTYEDLEVILVDDGSTDGSSEICDTFGEEDSRVVVLHKENGGLSDARNVGMKNAKGDFFAFIDSDDVIHPKFFETLMRTQEKYNADIVSCDIINFYLHSEISSLDSKKYSITENVLRNEEIVIYYFSQEEGFIYHGLCMKLYKKELFKELSFEIGRLHEDLFITYKLLYKCKCYVFVNAPYYYYYQNNHHSITKNYGKKNMFDEIDAIENMLNDFNDNEIIMDALIKFVLFHYLEILAKSLPLKKDKVIILKQKYLKKWMRDNLKNTSRISSLKKLQLYVYTCNIHLFSYTKKLKKKMHSLRRNKIYG